MLIYIFFYGLFFIPLIINSDAVLLNGLVSVVINPCIWVFIIIFGYISISTVYEKIAERKYFGMIIPFIIIIINVIPLRFLGIYSENLIMTVIFVFFNFLFWLIYLIQHKFFKLIFGGAEGAIMWYCIWILVTMPLIYVFMWPILAWVWDILFSLTPSTAIYSEFISIGHFAYGILWGLIDSKRNSYY